MVHVSYKFKKGNYFSLAFNGFFIFSLMACGTEKKENSKLDTSKYKNEWKIL